MKVPRRGWRNWWEGYRPTHIWSSKLKLNAPLSHWIPYVLSNSLHQYLNGTNGVGKECGKFNILFCFRYKWLGAHEFVESLSPNDSISISKNSLESITRELWWTYDWRAKFQFVFGFAWRGSSHQDHDPDPRRELACMKPWSGGLRMHTIDRLSSMLHTKAPKPNQKPVLDNTPNSQKFRCQSARSLGVWVGRLVEVTYAWPSGEPQENNVKDDISGQWIWRNAPSFGDPFQHHRFCPDFGEGLTSKHSPDIFWDSIRKTSTQSHQPLQDLSLSMPPLTRDSVKPYFPLCLKTFYLRLSMSLLLTVGC